MRHKIKIDEEELKASIIKRGGILQDVAIDFSVGYVRLKQSIKEYGLEEFVNEAYQNSPRRHMQPLNAIVRAFERCGGVVSDVAKMLDVDATTVYAYMRTYPQLNEIRQQARDEMLMNAEDTLGQLVRDGDWQAIKLVITSQGRKLGYASTTQLVADGESAITIRVVYGDE